MRRPFEDISSGACSGSSYEGFSGSCYSGYSTGEFRPSALIASDAVSEASDFAEFSDKVSEPTKRHSYTPMTHHLLNEVNEMAEDRKGAEQENR